MNRYTVIQEGEIVKNFLAIKEEEYTALLKSELGDKVNTLIRNVFLWVYIGEGKKAKQVHNKTYAVGVTLPELLDLAAKDMIKAFKEEAGDFEISIRQGFQIEVTDDMHFILSFRAAILN